jgi:hypothetical protein
VSCDGANAASHGNYASSTYGSGTADTPLGRNVHGELVEESKSCLRYVVRPP